MKIFYQEPLKAVYYREKNKAKYLTWNSIRLKIVNKTSMPNPVKSLAYINCHSSSSPTLASPSNSIRNNCEKIFSWSIIYNPIIYKFFKDFTNHRKKTNRVVVLSSRPFPNILIACVRYFLSSLYFSPNDSPLKMMKNVFYFI